MVGGKRHLGPVLVTATVGTVLVALLAPGPAGAATGAPPTVNAGPDQVLTTADTAFLPGRVSDDGQPAPSQVEARWSVVSGPGSVTFGRADEAFTSARFGTAGSYVLRLTADDGGGTASDDLALTVGTTHTATLRVPADYPTVQAALNAAPLDALVLVSPGTYRENVVVPRTLTLASTYYTTGDPAMIAATVISGPATGTDTIGVSAAAGPATRIVGLTVRDGKDGIETASGGHLVAEHNVVISGSDAFDFPRNSAGLVQHNTMSQNGDDGVDIDESSVVIVDNDVRDNQGDGVEARMTNVTAPQRAVVIRGNEFTGNRQDGLQIIDQDTIAPAAQSASLFTIERNVIADNGEAGLGLLDGGVTSEDYRGASLNERVVVLNNVFSRNNHGIVGGDNLVAVNNVLTRQTGPALKNVDGASVTAYNHFFANGAANVSSNVDAATAFSGDPLLDASWAPQPGSPLVDAGTTQVTLPGGEIAAQVADYLGSAPDIGAVESDGSAPSNRAPTVSAGPDLEVALPASASLVGSVSDDGRPAGGTLTRRWSVDSGPGTVGFADATAASTTATFSAAGSYVLRLTADDGELSAADTATVTVSDPPPGGGTSTTVEARVTAGADDAEESASGSVALTSGDLELVTDGSSVQTVGLRFPSLAVPRGATVTQARIQFSTDEVKTAATSLQVAAQDADNAAAFTTASRNVSSRPRTPAVAWSPPAWNTVGERAAAQLTSDLSSALQRVVSRTGWASGNAAAFVITGTGVRTAVAVEGGAATAPLLRVTYTTDGTSPTANAAPTVEAGADQSVTLPATASLSGTAADDGLPAGSPLTTTWSQVSGPGTVTFGNATQTATTAAFSTAGSYVLRLTASDGDLSATDTLTVTVTDAPPPGGTVSTVVVRPGTGSDDAEEAPSGSVALTSGDLELVTDGSSVQTVGLRFPGVAVPRGATITSAFVQLQVDEVSTDVAAMTVRGQAADNPTTFTTASRNVSTRPVTAASVAWSPATWPTVGERGTAQRTPDLRTLVQELVTRGGWASGNAMAFVFTGSGRRTAEAFESGAVLGPSLSVSWTTGGAGQANAAPSVDAGPDASVTRPAAATLSGSAVDDGLPTGSSVSTTWSQVSGPGTTTFADAGAPATTATFSAAGSYVLRLTATDGELSASDTVTVTVADAPPGGTVTTLDVRVGTGADDVEESPSGSVNLSSSDLELVADGSSVQTVGIRFPALAVPRGATIVRAWVQFSADEATTAAASLSVALQDADTAAAFANTARNVSSRPRTAAVAWAPASWQTVGARGADQRTPDLAVPLQRVVGRAGWAPGNAVAVVVTGTGVRTAVALEGGTAGAPVLHVEYQP